MTRAFLKSNVEKALNDNTIVIFDSLNYIKGNLELFYFAVFKNEIKGYRYELFCLVRSYKTTHCIVIKNIFKKIMNLVSCFAIPNMKCAKSIKTKI